MIQSLSDEGVRFIQKWEGFEPSIYKDAAGFSTIGYGHLLKLGEQDRYQQGITIAEAANLLRQDVHAAERAVRQFITITLNQPQFDALVSFTFNVGAATLQRSTLRQVINRGEHAQVIAQLNRFVWAGGRKLSGLIARRQAEGRLYIKKVSD